MSARRDERERDIGIGALERIRNRFAIAIGAGERHQDGLSPRHLDIGERTQRHRGICRISSGSNRKPRF